MHMMTSNQRQDKVKKDYRKKLAQDLFKVAALVVGLKCLSYAITKET